MYYSLIFLSGINDSTIFVILLLFFLFIALVYFLIRFILYLCNYSELINTSLKKVILFILCGIIVYFMLSMSYQLTGKGLLQ
ncbi:hypothetical protein SAMN05660845_0340 [Flavobacterium swingsii]|uniref:Uncharacterized protein n=1 Tax=Flavobacterium swingsii TaxID=498292 RepID=A0A1I0VET9_9FLAO|nr:hypothetical protein SAMN05660845_0340 [Flavobacterium swingsii]